MTRTSLLIRLPEDMKLALGRLAFESDVTMNDVIVELVARATGFGFVGYERVMKRPKYGKNRRLFRFYARVPGAISGID